MNITFLTLMLTRIKHGIPKLVKVLHRGEKAAPSPLVRVVNVRSILQPSVLIPYVVSEGTGTIV